MLAAIIIWIEANNKVFIELLYFTGSVNVCKQNVKTSGVEGTITASFTEEQLNNEDYECILQFENVPAYSVFELYVSSYSYPYDCLCGRRRPCNYLVFEGFTEPRSWCLSSTSRFYRYRSTTGSISIVPVITNFASLEFNLNYRSKSIF